MDDELAIPEHLRITTEAAARLQRGWSTNNALVGGLADLEAFIRTQPDDAPFINAGPLEDFPITKEVVNKFEHLSNDTGGKISHGIAALTQLGFVITALKSLEAQNQQLASRVAKLEKR